MLLVRLNSAIIRGDVSSLNVAMMTWQRGREEDTAHMTQQSQQIDAVQSVYDVLAPTYDNTFTSPIALAENMIVRRKLRSFLSQDHQGDLKPFVLDLACGTGFFLEQCPLPAWGYIGIDISTGMLAEARRKFPINTFFEGDMQDLSRFDHETFSHITSLFCGLSYVPNQIQSLQECWRVLRPGGRLFLMVYGPSYRERPSYILNRHGLSLPLYLHSALAMRQMVRSVGFQHVEVQGFHASIERCFSSAPVRFLTKALWAEMYTIGKRNPDVCYFHLIFATKPLQKG